MTIKNKKRGKKHKEHADAWEPRPGRKDRPTPERRMKGKWGLLDTEDAGVRHAKDFEAHPIDSLEHRGVISNQQASAGRDFEALYRAAIQTPQTRDSCLTWQPKGYESDDGNFAAVEARRELYLFLGVARDRFLRRVCVDHQEPKPRDIGILRECLNECVRFFK